MSRRAPARRRAARQRIVFGDWQTPPALAQEVIGVLARRGEAPRAVIEPTCGRGALLVAAHRTWASAALVGVDINEGHVLRARARLPASARVERADFFAVDWSTMWSDLPEPWLIVGNPPWVTSAELGALQGDNAPPKRSVHGVGGLDALTGKANFDVSQWMTLQLLRAALGRRFTLAFLCKSIVARRVIEAATRERWPLRGELRAIDAGAHFGAAVDAVLLIVSSSPGVAPAGPETRWPSYASLAAGRPSRVLGCPEGEAVPDLDAYAGTAHLAGWCTPEWRSGIKHDCAGVMELLCADGVYTSRVAGRVDLERAHVFPLLKGADVAHARLPPTRALLVPQRRLGQPTRGLEQTAPRTWRYLCAHRERLAARRSAVYARQPEFAVFGVGEYAFAPWKVAVAGLYKRPTFLLVGPYRGRPVVFDDTVYFLPFETEQGARAAHRALSSELAARFFAGRVFWGDKRPIRKALLQALDLAVVQAELRAGSS